MGFELRCDLERFSKMAFLRAADCTEVIKRFHGLSEEARVERRSPKSKVQPRLRALGARRPKSSQQERHSDYELLRRVYEWVFVPMSIWPVDVRGLCLYLLGCIEDGVRVDERARLLCEYLAEVPPAEVCERVSEYEHAVKAGSYESLIRAQFKFDSMEAELRENKEFKRDWARLKRQFAVEKFRNARGVIRRRRVEERNFRASDWRFSWATEEERFQMVFDAFCHRWDLYGMEGERPLLLKLSVNVTPFSTMIEVPKYWSFDPKRDLKWGAITKLHRMREVSRQGPKLSPILAERREEAARAKEFWREATKAGMRGDRRKEWVMEKLGWDGRTDDSKLRRLLKG